MFCPICHKTESKVLESRLSKENKAVRRRRECLLCGFRFSTYEQAEILSLTVIKRDGRREPYNLDKLSGGIAKAFEKRDISEAEVKRLTEAVERAIYKKSKQKEIKSEDIGKIVMGKIKRKDPVAYMRFASVYMQFQHIEDFEQAVNKLNRYQVN